MDGLWVRVRDSVPGKQAGAEEATGGRDMWEVQVLAGRRGRQPTGGEGAIHARQADPRRGACQDEGHTGQCPGGEGSGEGTSSTRLQGQCSEAGVMGSVPGYRGGVRRAQGKRTTMVGRVRYQGKG